MDRLPEPTPVGYAVASYNRLQRHSHHDFVEPYTTPDLAEMCDLVKESNTNLHDIFGGNNNV